MWKEDKKNGSGKLIIGDEVFIQKYQRGTLVSSYNENSVSSENLFNNINEMIHSLVEKEKNSLFQELEEQKEVLENEREKLNDMKKNIEEEREKANNFYKIEKEKWEREKDKQKYDFEFEMGSMTQEMERIKRENEYEKEKLGEEKKRRIEKLKEEIYQFNNNEKTKWEIERENQMKNFVDEKRKLIEELEFFFKNTERG